MQPHMQLTSRHLIVQYAHILQQDLFPKLEEAAGPLSPQLRLLASVMPLLPLAKLLNGRRARTGRPAKDRLALATAFLAKAILNLATTRDLIDRLRVDSALRRFCGWYSVEALPHESKFSRAFAEFAAMQLPQQLHDVVVQTLQGKRIVCHIARDSTAIPARERFPEASRKKKLSEQAPQPKHPKGSFRKAKASEHGTRIKRQRHQKLSNMLAELPQQCDIGVKSSKEGKVKYWRGYKLHLDVADGQVPISAWLTSASVHDSQVAIPLMTMTSKRVRYFYDLMDSAYDADPIHAHSGKLKHFPIIAPHPRRGTKRPSEVPKIYPAQPTPQLTWAQQDRYKERTMIERVNARLKDEFGASQIRVRGPAKVMAHLMFGVLALTVDQFLRLQLA